MSAEREIAGFVLPFTVGTAASFIIFQHSYAVSAYSAHVSLLTASTLSILLLHPIHKDLSYRILWTFIGILAFCTGCFSYLSDQSSRDFATEIFPSYRNLAAGFGELMSNSIARLPMQDTDTNHLINALITGDRSGISEETLEAFRKSGASHILSLSGFHLGIIYGILRAIFSLFGNSRSSKFLRSLVLISICGFYTSATGARASITRAFLFILLGETASLTGRYRNIKNILWTALLIQLVIKPEEIRDIGFQLSYAAIFGIAYIYPHLKGAWPEKSKDKGIIHRSLHWIWASVSMSIACQVTTGPLAFMYFGTFPKYFLLTNMIALPLAGLIIPMSLTMLLLHNLGLCPDILFQLTEWVINIFTESLKTIASL